MKKKFPLILWAGLAAGLLFFSCKKSFLEEKPVGILGDAEVATPAGVDKLLTGAYAGLGGQFIPDNQWVFSVFTQPDNWLFGSVCGGDAHRGSNPGDNNDITQIARFDGLPTTGGFDDKWTWLYDAIVRCNAVLRILKQVEGISPEETVNIQGQARFLRGLYFFELKKFYNMVPWIDEDSINYKIKNDQDIWPAIEADFKFAYDNLPEGQDLVGRANKWAAGAYLAKTYMFQKKYSDALPVLNDVINNGKTPLLVPYGLLDKFSDNFNYTTKNQKESVFAVQAAINTGTGGYQGNIADLLNFPYGGGAVTGCCGFFQPSIELVNSFRTDADGLPLLDGSYDAPTNAVKNDQGLASGDPFTPDAGNLDPRVDWTAGRRGIPYLDWGNHPGADWIRDQPTAGPYSPKKNVFYENQVGTGGDNASATWAPTTAINYCMIRFADVLLWAAEAEVEAGSLEKARGYVNQIRQRAANPDDFVRNPDNSPAAHYVIGLYNDPWTDQAMARKAVQFERKLELAMEGHRFFDLVRWGMADTEINGYFNYESQFTSDIAGAHFAKDKNEYYPIPQVQIDISSKTLTQNPGYR
jgi:hypothetical protein